MKKIGAIISWLYDHLGDPRTKNVIIVALLIACVFGVVAPERATGLRDIVLSMPF
jgi:hypothetical protein